MATEILGASHPVTPNNTAKISPSIDNIMSQSDGIVVYTREGRTADISLPVLKGVWYPVANLELIKESSTATVLVGF